MSEAPVQTDIRLGIWIYWLGRGDYYHAIAELAGLGEATVCNIVHDVSKAIVEHLWKDMLEITFQEMRNS